MTPDLRHRLRALAIVVVGPRTDWEFLVDPLVGYFRTALTDFWVTHEGDSSEGFSSPQARREWWETRLRDMAAWDAQVQEQESA